MNTDIINPQTAAELVAAYEQASKDITAAYDLLQKAKDNLQTAFGEHCYMDPLPREVSGYEPAKNSAMVIDKIRRRAWGKLIDMTGIKKLLSTSRADKLSETIDRGKMPELTVTEIYRMFDDLTGSAKQLLTEAIQEVYDFLRVGATEKWGGEYKTNRKNARFEIKDKVIIGWMVESNFGGGMRVRYGSEDKLRALDKVFYALDGKGIPGGYKSPLIDAINTGAEQTDYFNLKVYQNGNLHLSFRRPDLVKQLNAIAADHTTMGGA